jgi:MFS family permease
VKAAGERGSPEHPVVRATRKGVDLARRRIVPVLGGAARTRVVLVLACVLALASADTATVGAAAVELRQALHVGNTDIGLLVAVTAVVAAVFSLPFGVLADRVRRTHLLSLALLGWSVAMVWSATAGSFTELLYARLALGGVSAAAGPVTASLVGDWFLPSERGQIYSFVLAGELVGAGAGFAITGDVAALSWRVAFVVLALPALPIAWATFHLPEPARGGAGVLAPEARTNGTDNPNNQPAAAAGAYTAHPPAQPAAKGGTAAPATAKIAPANRRGWGGWSPPPPRANMPPPTGRPAAGVPPPPPRTGPPPGGMPPPRGAKRSEGWAPPPPRSGRQRAQLSDAQRLVLERGIRPDPALAARARPGMGFLAAVRYVLAVRTNVALIIAGACGYYFLAGVETFGEEFVSHQYHVSQVVSNLLLLIVGTGAVAGVLVAGPLGDRLLHRGRTSGRVLVAAVSASAAVVFLVPALLTHSALAALPYLLMAAASISAQNPPIDAARLDIVPSWLWGRAEGVRTFVRTAAQALAPLVFGAFSEYVFGGGNQGLYWTFVVMLVPMSASAVYLFSAAHRYPRDVATAVLAAQSADRRQ